PNRVPVSGCGARTQANEFRALDELYEPPCLSPKAAHEVGPDKSSLSIEEIVDLRQKNSFRIKQSVTIAENHLQLLDRPQRSPHAGPEPNEADRPPFEAL